jgi:hypothetical protein
MNTNSLSTYDRDVLSPMSSSSILPRGLHRFAAAKPFAKAGAERYFYPAFNANGQSRGHVGPSGHGNTNVVGIFGMRPPSNKDVPHPSMDTSLTARGQCLSFDSSVSEKEQVQC